MKTTRFVSLMALASFAIASASSQASDAAMAKLLDCMKLKAASAEQQACMSQVERCATRRPRRPAEIAVGATARKGAQGPQAAGKLAPAPAPRSRSNLRPLPRQSASPCASQLAKHRGHGHPSRAVGDAANRVNLQNAQVRQQRKPFGSATTRSPSWPASSDAGHRQQPAFGRREHCRQGETGQPHRRSPPCSGRGLRRRAEGCAPRPKSRRRRRS